MIELESKATGILSTGSAWEGETPETPRKFGTLVAPQLYAPIHTHTFVCRLDMAVDGIDNSVYEVRDVPTFVDVRARYRVCGGGGCTIFGFCGAKRTGATTSLERK